MKIGTLRGALFGLNYTERELYTKLRELGFDSVDYSFTVSYKDRLWKMTDEQLRNELESVGDMIRESGLIVGQTHSPIDADWFTTPETKEERWHAQVQAIKATAFIGSPYVVIHPLCPPGRVHDPQYYEYAKACNMEYYRFLEPYLQEYGVKAAIENLFVNDKILGRTAKTSCSTADSLIDYIETLGSDRFVACLDVGHATLSGQDPVEMIYQLGKKYLHVTHMHDNDYINDDHYMPGIGKIDWYAIGKALNDIEYEDVFSFEANRTFRRIEPYAKELTLDFLKVYVALARTITSIK